jgi:hypothetical protein
MSQLFWQRDDPSCIGAPKYYKEYYKYAYKQDM